MHIHFRVLLITLMLLFMKTSVSAHNGKYCISKSIQEVVVDGNLNDWSGYENYQIELQQGDPFSDSEDGSAQFKIAHNCSSQHLFLAITIKDDDYRVAQNNIDEWRKVDEYSLFLNFNHTEYSPGIIQLRFSGEHLKIDKHSEDLDPIHFNFSKENVQHQFHKNENEIVYEIKIDFYNAMTCNQSIGIDHNIIDVDEGSRSELSWGEGIWKYFMPGQLGDVIITDATSTKEIQGQVVWAKMENDKLPLPSKVKIQSTTHKGNWIHAAVDSTGSFKANLPLGEYRISSGELITNPSEMGDYDNHFQVISKKLIVDLNNKSRVDTLELSTVGPPTYLIREQGILHAYEKKRDEFAVDNFIETYRQYYKVPAVSLAMIEDNKIVYNKSFGTRNPISGNPVDSNTLFQTASISKSVFAFIVMRLAESGEIDLDRPLHEYLPFKNIEHNEGYKLITPRIVLSHQTGLDNWPLGGPDGWQSEDKVDLKFEPGTNFSYSGEAYQWLSRAIEKITNKTTEELLESEVKKPLGIENMYFQSNDKLIQTRGTWSLLPTFWGMPPRVGVAHSLLSEAGDFAKLVVELGKQDHLKKETYKDMFTPRPYEANGFILPADSIYQNRKMGLGFYVRESKYGNVICHGGNNAEFQGLFLYFIEQKKGFVILTNSNMGHKIWHGLERFLIFGNN